MFKRFFLKSGEKLIDILAGLSLVIIVLVGIGATSQATSFGEGLLIFIAVEIVGFVYATFVFFFIYLMLEIRNVLKKIEENTCHKE